MPADPVALSDAALRRALGAQVADGRQVSLAQEVAAGRDALPGQDAHDSLAVDAVLCRHLGDGRAAAVVGGDLLRLVSGTRGVAGRRVRPSVGREAVCR